MSKVRSDEDLRDGCFHAEYARSLLKHKDEQTNPVPIQLILITFKKLI